MPTTRGHVSRVDQLDAEALDEEILSILRSSLSNAFSELHPIWLLSMEPELFALLRLLLWKYTVHKSGASLGQKLLLLEYRDSEGNLINKFKSWCLSGADIGGHWLNDRVKLGLLTLVTPRYRHKVQWLWKWLQSLFGISSLLNFLLFLRYGRYRSLPERILHISSENSRPHNIRQVQYEYMNRELLWHGFAEFLTFALPLLNLRRVRNQLCKFLWSSHGQKTSPFERVLEDLTACAYCEEAPILPHDIGCKHVFCHYCIQSNVLADTNFQCPKCPNQAQGAYSIRPVIETIHVD